MFVPEQIPKLDVSMEALSKMTYQETAYTVMKQFLTDFSEEELKDCIRKAYDSKFDTGEIAPIVKAGDAYYLELFHGATIAFKDMALSILPHLLTTSAKKHHVENEIVILTATSGDTGKAAMAGFADVEGTRIIVFYPKDGVSEVQKLQMITQKGSNVDVAALHGNFDDAQSGVKALFEDEAFAEVLNEKDFSCPLQIQSISDALYLKWFTMFMLMRSCWHMVRSKMEKRSMSLYLQVILEIFWQHITQNRWECLSLS